LRYIINKINSTITSTAIAEKFEIKKLLLLTNFFNNVEKNIDSNTELEEVSYVDDGLRNFSIPYS